MLAVRSSIPLLSLVALCLSSMVATSAPVNHQQAAVDDLYLNKEAPEQCYYSCPRRFGEEPLTSGPLSENVHRCEYRYNVFCEYTIRDGKLLTHGSGCASRATGAICGAPPYAFPHSFAVPKRVTSGSRLEQWDYQRDENGREPSAVEKFFISKPYFRA